MQGIPPYFDVIGDLHGHADALKQLLTRMGYQRNNGAYQHPERKTLFLGDFIDRGPQQLEVLNLVRDMMDAGQAEAVMGNHELNAIGWWYETAAGEPLRPHSAKNRFHHQAFLEQVGENSAQHQRWVEWFTTLPIWLEKPELQLVHACWCEASMAVIRPLLSADLQLLPHTREAFFSKGSTPNQVIDILLKGLEVKLPQSHAFEDKDGTRRDTTRLQWWQASRHSQTQSLTLDQLAMGSKHQTQRLPRRSMADLLSPYAGISKPTFIGHYWLTGIPAPLAPRIACLDYSVAKQGHLAAYRFNGESELTAEGFVVQPA